MYIVWYGQSFFEIGARGAENVAVKIAIDPYSGEIGLKPPKTEADILLVSHQHKDHFNIETIKGNPFLIDSPGEYEVKGVFIKGIPAFHDNQQGKERGGVILYKIEAEEITLCHLSDLGQKELTPEQIEELGEIDVLFVPVGGTYTIGAKEALAIIAQTEPRMVIPMHYKIPGLKINLEGVDKFLKIIGKESLEPQKKLKITPKDLPQEEAEIVVLSP